MPATGYLYTQVRSLAYTQPHPPYPPTFPVIARSVATKQSLTAIVWDCFASLAMTRQTEGEEKERGASAPLGLPKSSLAKMLVIVIDIVFSSDSEAHNY